MQSPRPKVVGIGEVLWDMLPEGAHLGGAPANFCYIAAALGASAAIVSRVGEDELGEQALSSLSANGLNTGHIQRDPAHATGTVGVILDSGGKPSYSIVEDVAWDHIEWTPDLAALAQGAHAVCFGSLAQRSERSGSAIAQFLKHTPPACLRVFDVNLRPPFYSAEGVRESIARANVLKLNDEELPLVLKACGLASLPVMEGARALRERFSLRAVCITRGASGSVIDTAEESVEHPGAKVSVADTVGAGDAFTAALTVSLLAGRSLKEISRFANHIAGLVASRRGAMPEFTPADRDLLDWVAR